MILVTGGAGYIGSHTVAALLDAGREVLVLDNLSNSKPSVLARIARVAGRAPAFVQGDVLDEAVLDAVFSEHAIEAVIHFAGLKAVGESVADPLRYYRNNVSGSQNLLRAMTRHGVFRFVFSSSATVYGDPERVPVPERAPTRPESPYGHSKLMVERMCQDLAASDPRWRVALLRYFNPVGAHPSGWLGEDPNGVPNNLMPYIAQVAAGRLARLRVFGQDYATPDGTGVRDYIHVQDLAEGHLAALAHLDRVGGAHVFNLGTGRGYSVLEMLAAFERACGRELPREFVARRPGDVAIYYADPARAERELGWRARLGVDAMCADTWRWQCRQRDELDADGNPV